MKKIIAIVLILALALTFAACGKTEESKEADQTIKETKVKITAEEKEEPTEADKQNHQAEEPATEIAEDVTEKAEITTNDSAQTTKNDGKKPENEKESTTQKAPAAKPAVTKPAVTKPAATKPAATKPATTKPATTKPATTKPATTKPAVTVAPTTEAPKNNVFFNANNNVIQKNSIAIRPRYVYWENGYLVAECFVINGYDYAVSQINVKNLSFSNSGGLIASAGFGTIGNVTLQPNAHVVWTFKFAPNTISRANANLSSLTSNTQCSYVY